MSTQTPKRRSELNCSGTAGKTYAATAEDSVRAHLALNARRMFPVHWATFHLAFHDWDKPVKRTIAAVKNTNIEPVTPRVGEVVTAGEPFRSTNWWETVNAGSGTN